jgi:hypothetical protein
VTAVHILLLLNLAALAALLVRLLRLQREVSALRARSQALAAAADEIPAELRQLARDGASMLSIRILNPMELAAQKHWVAGVAGRLTPGLVRHIVSREAAKIVRQELPKYGVVAQVEVVPND